MQPTQGYGIGATPTWGYGGWVSGVATVYPDYLWASLIASRLYATCTAKKLNAEMAKEDVKAVMVRGE